MVGNALGLWRRNGQVFERLLEAPVTQLAADPGGGSWALANDLHRVEGSRATRTAGALGGATGPLAAVAADAGGVWLATAAGSVLFRDAAGSVRVVASGLDRPRQL